MNKLIYAPWKADASSAVHGEFLAQELTMRFSKLLPLFALAVVFAFASTAAAEEKVVDNCKVVKTEGNKLFITDPKGGQHSAEVTSSAKITIDGKDAKLGDLKEGLKVKLTLEKGDGNIQIVKVEGSTS
jgi:hypothetical protein